MSSLFSPISLGAVTLDNRIVIAPMCQYSAEEGRATDWHTIHLGQLALSGAGLLIVEATAVEAIGRITACDLGLYDDAAEAALGKVVRAIRRHSPIKLGVQIAHAGRKASNQVPWEGGRQIPVAQGGWRCVAPSALPFEESEEAPLALDAAGLARVRQAFVDAALRAARLGFDLIELHGAHGYLLHQFLSPLSNQRSDAYGGSPENRMRFSLEVFAAVREAVPAAVAVGIRVSATDWVEGGLDVTRIVEFARALQTRRCDFIHVSTAGLSPLQKIPLAPGYQVPFAEIVKRETGLPTIAVGLITEAGQAEEIVRKGKADMVALARGMLYDPRWPWHAAAKLGASVDAAKQYWRCQPSEFKTLFRQP